ncbi:hypothetical protein L1987_53229 [Smallanthus sonchifolius]|uniref:Uncharacterized protein n=1 Tax=Smallanthus sonchifolius TaxID=185202 RepID=A0ACB9EUP3_9ASTR|nr:hypothetical protein L1987_53229 [Smallanthus sonchifolius]
MNPSSSLFYNPLPYLYSHFNPAMNPTSSLFYNPLPYPYTWYVYDVYGGYHPEPYDEVLILDSFDHETEHYNNGGRYHPYDEVMILDGFDHETEHYYNGGGRYNPSDEVMILDGFDDETEHCNNGGLNKKLIDRNLKGAVEKVWC